jgi:hypothetical protein
MISGVIAASEYLPRCLSRITACRFSATMRHGSFGRSDFGDVALESVRKGHSIRRCPLHISPAHHFIFSAARPVIGISFRAERLRGCLAPAKRIPQLRISEGEDDD